MAVSILTAILILGLPLPIESASILPVPISDPVNNSRFVSQSVPTDMLPGNKYQVSITFKNVGRTVWASGSYILVSQNPPLNRTWLVPVIRSPSPAIRPGQTKTFTFTVSAPSKSGSYNFQWQMYKKGRGFFDQKSDNLIIKVNTPPALDPIDNKTTFEHRVVQFTVSGSDPDNDQLVYSASNLPSGATFDTQSHTFSWTPEHGQKGTYSNISFQDALGTTTYTYDELYRLKTITNPYGQVISYDYDAVGNVTKITYPDNKTVTYTYDELNRLKTVTNWLSQTATYTYDDAGRLTGVTNFNGTMAEYGYDNADRLISLQNKTESLGTIISSYDYVLDDNDNPIRVTQTEPIAPVVPEENMNYVYNDAKNRLLSAGLTNFSYDDEGRLLTKGATSYSYDYEHRLKSVIASPPEAGEAIYFYDGMGNRLQATRNGTVTRYIYDADGNLLAETDASNAITRYYIHGLGLLAFVTPSGETHTYHYNGTGDTIAITDSTKTIVNKYCYTPFGEVTNQVEAISQPFKFAGGSGAMAEPNGLCLMGERAYDPAIGRFLSEEPMAAAAGTNAYAFAGK